MRFQKVFRVVMTLVFATAAWIRATPAALAQTPANDDFGSAIVITSLSFHSTMDTSEATAAADDPIDCSNNGSVWYAYTPPADTVLTADTFGSDYDTVLSVYTGARGSLTQVPDACNDDFEGLQSHVGFAATGGTTYYFLVAFCCGNGGTGGGNLTFSLSDVLAPPNDNFADSLMISELPFIDAGAIAGASLEPDEPVPSCIGAGDLQNSVWYSFASTADDLMTVDALGSTPTLIAVYSGSGLDNLEEVGCRPVENVLTFQASAGITYFFQIGSLGALGDEFAFALSVAEPLFADFYYEPESPSRFDETEFFSDSFDPGGGEIVSQEWDFGDGTTATGCCPTHRFTRNGDYVVSLTVTTDDGRQASALHSVHVETHDVMITSFQTPKSGRLNRTRKISVGISSRLQAETVTVELYSSQPSGYQLVGRLTQYVPRRTNNGTTNFLFSYTFTPTDADIGKLNFRAVALLQNARDALPADNEAISFPVRVRSAAAGESVAAEPEDPTIQEGFYLSDQLDGNGKPIDVSDVLEHSIFLPRINDAR